MTSQTGAGVCITVYEAECHATARWNDPGYTTVPASPVRWHIDMLIDSGHTAGSIAAIAGVSQRAVKRIQTRRVRMTARTTADRILAVHKDETPSEARHSVPASMIRPLVDQMRRRGMTYAEINRESGCSHSRRSANVSKRVQYETWYRITALYTELARDGMVNASLLYVGGTS